MAGLVPAIMSPSSCLQKKEMDARHKAGHDDQFGAFAAY